jgi:hypothetical protein
MRRAGVQGAAKVSAGVAKVSPIAVRDVIDAEHNTYAAIAERSVVIGYDELIGAVTITGAAATPEL